VVGFLKPDAAPDAFGFERGWQPAEPLPQLADLDLEALVDRRAWWAALAGGSGVVRLRDDRTVPNTFTKVFGIQYAICTELFLSRRRDATTSASVAERAVVWCAARDNS
jgi:hypothetical protein